MSDQDTIIKYLNGELSNEELEAFKLTSDYEFISSLDSELNSFKAPDQPFGEFVFKEKKPPQAKRRYLRPLLQIAAMILIVSSVVFYFMPSTSKVSTVNGMTTSLMLPDESKVILNADSEIRYDKDEWSSSNRFVTLTGEAYFQVEEGKKFTVQTSIGNVAVVGTAFNVVQRDDFFSVVCYEGKVKVMVSNKEYLLSPSQALQWTQAGIAAFQDHINAQPEWLSGKSSFRSAPYQLVINEFARQYDVYLQVQHVDVDRLFTGSFDHENMEDALKSITIPLNISYKIEENRILLFTSENH